MSKTAAWLGMAGIVLVLLGADLAVLTRTESLSRIADAELRKRAGDVLSWSSLRASLDGIVTLEGLAHRTLPIGVERAEVRMRSLLEGTVEELTLEGVHVGLTEKLLEDLSKPSGKKRSIRDLFPDPRGLPRVRVRRLTVRAELPAVFAQPQEIRVRDLALAPVDGWRVRGEARFENDLAGAWTAEGEADLDGGAWGLRLETKALTFDPSMEPRLAGEARAILQKYRPTGRCGLRAAFAQEPGRELDFRATLLAEDLGLTYRNFPYAVTGGRGEIDFTAKGFRIKHMEGRHGPATIRFDGWAGGYEKEADFQFRVEIDDAPLDADLRAALKPGTQKVWDLFTPRGTVSARARATREAGPDREERVPVELTFRDATARFRSFPYELRNLAGDVRVDGERIEVRRLRSSEGDAEIEVSGTIADISGDSGIDLAIDARRLRLDDRLKGALPEGPRKLWEDFLPGGEADVRWSVRKEKGKPDVQTGRIRALGGTALYREVPIPVTDLRGEIEVEEGAVRLRHLTGKAGEARIGIHGSVTDAGTTLDELTVVGLTLDEATRDKMPKELAQLIKDIRLSGRVNARGSVELKKEGEHRLSMALDLHKGVLAIEPRFEDLEGNAWLDGSFGKKTSVMGLLSFPRATVWGKRVSDLGATLLLLDTRVAFRGIKAGAYGGLVAGELSFDTKSLDLAGGFTVDRLDLKEYVLDTQGYSKKMVAGKLSVDLRDLSGKAGDAASLKGTGVLKIQDGQLWDIPVFVNLFNLNLDMIKGKNQFDTGAIDFEIRHGKFDIKHLLFTSESMSVVGRGRLNFNGDLHLILKPQSGRLLGIDFFATNWIASALSWFTGGFMGVDVTGTFDKPETSLKPFQGFR